jgi:hypothetical protein
MPAGRPCPPLLGDMSNIPDDAAARLAELWRLKYRIKYR